MLSEYIKGLLAVSVEGVNLERFINKCNAAGILLYNVNRERYDLMFCRVKYGDMKLIAQLNRELKCRIKIKGRYGLRFLMHRISRRKAFIVGMAMFIVFITVMSSSIWRIDISGTDRITPTQVIEVINGMGAGVGIFKTRCDTKTLELAIKKELSDVDWVIVEFHGVVMNIRIIESVQGVERENKTPASIVSEVNGEIVSINALRGDKKVFVGSKVKVGQVLIDGIYDRLNQHGFYKLENAQGSIIARVNYSGSAEICIDDIDKRAFTGKEKTVYTLEMFGKTFGKTDIEYENYTEETKTYNLFKKGRLFPIKATKTVYKEYNIKSDGELYQEAQDKLLNMAYNDAERLIPIGAQTESQSIEYVYDNVTRTLSAETLVTALHEIGVKRPLEQDEIDYIKTKSEGTKNE